MLIAKEHFVQTKRKRRSRFDTMNISSVVKFLF